MLALAYAPVAAAAPGDHIRAGVVTIVPRVDIGIVYHSNIYRAEDNPSPAMNGVLSPGVNASAGGDDHEFSLDGSWNLEKYLFVGGESVPTGGRAARIGNLDRYDSFAVGGSADLFKRSLVGLKISDQLTRRNWTMDQEAAEVPYTSQLRNAFATGLRTNPAPALEVTPAVTWTYDKYQQPLLSDDVDDSRELNGRHMIGPRLDTKWAFLPRTALVNHLEYTYNTWTNNSVESGFVVGDGDPITVANTNIVKGSIGIDGRFTTRVFAQAFIGYGAGLVADASVPGAPALATENLRPVDGLLAKAQIRYAIVPATQESPGASISLGYIKDFRTSFFTNFISVNQLFTEFKGRFDDFEPMLRYELRFENYDGVVDRSDLVNVVRGGVGWNPAEYVQIHGGLSFLARTSTTDTIEYNDVMLNLGATFQY